MGQYMKADPTLSHDKQMAYYHNIIRGQNIMRLVTLLVALVFFLFMGIHLCFAQQSPYNNTILGPVTITATNTTSSAIPLSGGTSPAIGSSFSSCTVSLTGSGLTTVTFGLTGSADGGINYFAVPMATLLAPGTLVTTATATTGGLYRLNCAGLTHLKIVTSGTFTATSVNFTVTAAPIALTLNGIGTGGSAFNPSAVAITGGTIDGTVIGGTTPAAGSFTNASLSGALYIAGNFGDTNPSLQLLFTNLGFSPGANLINIVAAGNAVAQVANNGGANTRFLLAGTLPFEWTSGQNTSQFAPDTSLSRLGPASVGCGAGSQGDVSCTFTAQFYVGPTAAPSGTCATKGLWALSQDGHATYCPSNGGTWATKI